MFINRYNIHFHECNPISVKNVYKAGFCMQKQSGNSFTQHHRDESGKPFSEYFKEAELNYQEKQKSNKK
jgi:hypothetical protein